MAEKKFIRLTETVHGAGWACKIGPGDLNIARLVEKAESGSVAEIILALPTTIEGDTTNFYLYKKLSSSKIPLTTIARGISVGDELEHTDEVTLGRSIVNRTPYENTLQKKHS